MRKTAPFMLGLRRLTLLVCAAQLVLRTICAKQHEKSRDSIPPSNTREWFSGNPRITRADGALNDGVTWDDSHCNKDLSLMPPVVRENCLPGVNSTIWDVNGAGDWSIQGFATQISVAPGDTAAFKIQTSSTKYRIDIFRMGFYRGDGARHVATVQPLQNLPQTQPPCLEDDATKLIDCGTWKVSAEWAVPTDAVSGLYLARPTREDKTNQDEPKSWRSDIGRIQGDRLHARPGADPYDPPTNTPHSYGANGFGSLKNELAEPRASHIWFVVRQPPSNVRSDIVVQTSDATWHAYNGWGGFTTYGSFKAPYTHPPNARYMSEKESLTRAHKRSYNTPLITRDYRPVNMPLNSEYPLIRFLESNGYDVAYTTCVDVAYRMNELDGHKLFISVGHDEYWSGPQRQAVTEARDKGLHLAFLSGNEVYWKTRYERSATDKYADSDPSGQRTLVVYKDTQSHTALDPIEWTGTWRDDRSVNREGGRPENELTGTIFTVNAQRMDALQIPSTFRSLRQWRNTDIAQLNFGEAYTTFKGVLGHEWDEDLDNGHRPTGQIRLSETTVNNVQYIQDHGSVFDTGTATHHLTLHKMPSGAHVFGAGTVQWVWGLDPEHDPNDPPRANAYDIRVERDTNGPDPAIRQAMVNIVGDMKIRPRTLQVAWGLVAAVASTDYQPPTSSILSIAENLLQDPHSVTVIGQARDRGGGVVAAMEVSLDGGERFHPMHKVPQSANWSYTWKDAPPDSLYDNPTKYKVQHGTLHVMVRAVDDSMNVEIAHSTMERAKEEL